jgi:hypothetical protein
VASRGWITNGVLFEDCTGDKRTTRRGSVNSVNSGRLDMPHRSAVKPGLTLAARNEIAVEGFLCYLRTLNS